MGKLSNSKNRRSKRRFHRTQCEFSALLEKIKVFSIFVAVYRAPHILAVLAALTLCLNASAQRVAFGLYNSIKGFGLCLDVASADDTYVDALVIFADIYGFPTGRAESPGFKFNYSREFFIDRIETPEAAFTFYLGPGFTTGFAKDYEKSYFQDFAKPLEKNHGAIAALSGTGGCRISFQRKVELDLSMTLEAGLFFRRDEKGSQVHVGLYKNGIFEAFYPQLSIVSYF